MKVTKGHLFLRYIFDESVLFTPIFCSEALVKKFCIMIITFKKHVQTVRFNGHIWGNLVKNYYNAQLALFYAGNDADLMQILVWNKITVS